MIQIETDLGPVYILQSVNELPILPDDMDTLFMDVETTSFDPKVEAFLPYNGHRVAGIGFTYDKFEGAYYIPIRHTDKHWNLSVKEVMKWADRELKKAKRWRNHGIKFDAHSMWQDGWEWEGEWICSLTEAKMLDSDRLGHKLKSLCREWASIPMVEEGEVTAWLKSSKSKNYGDVPADILGKYGGMDVMGNRALCNYMDPRFDKSLDLLRTNESLLTPVLFDCEREGLRADKTKLKIEALMTMHRIINIASEIEEIIGFEYTDSNKALMSIFCGQYGLPVLSYKRNKDDSGNWVKGNPSFDKDALQLYLQHEKVRTDPEILELVELIVKYRTENTFNSLFLMPYLELADAEFILHPFYNQAVRTGRMSCSHPNAQQLNKRAKAIIIPKDEEGFLSCDASQIEFRLIVHYIEDEEAIQAYKDNPRTDFHQWVADMAHTDRPAGKTLNFATAFGAGKRKVTAELASSPGIAALVAEQLGETPDPAEFFRLCRIMASSLYDKYHERFPGIKATSKEAERTARIRGYVYGLFGRRRHLPKGHTHKAFNAVIQGSASDFVKSRMIALAARYNDKMRQWGVRIVAQVHDELLFTGPRAILQDQEFQAYVRSVLETSPIPLTVPILWDMGYSEVCWANAGADNPIMVNGVMEGRVLVAA